jgi:hypothetical protein
MGDDVWVAAAAVVVAVVVGAAVGAAAAQAMRAGLPPAEVWRVAAGGRPRQAHLEHRGPRGRDVSAARRCGCCAGRGDGGRS